MSLKLCKIMNVSRDTFYYYRELVDKDRVDALINRSCHAPNLKNRIDDAIEHSVVNDAIDFTAHNQHEFSNELHKNSVLDQETLYSG